MAGEIKAKKFLVKHNFQILNSNVAIGRSEVDLIAIDNKNNELVFVEVKTRSSNNFGHPSQAVNKQKIKSLQRVASAYLKKSKLDLDWRFDIITVLPSKIEHFENITWYN